MCWVPFGQCNTGPSTRCTTRRDKGSEWSDRNSDVLVFYKLREVFADGSQHNHNAHRYLQGVFAEFSGFAGLCRVVTDSSREKKSDPRGIWIDKARGHRYLQEVQKTRKSIRKSVRDFCNEGDRPHKRLDHICAECYLTA